MTDSDDNDPATFTRLQHRKLLNLLEEYERRRWAMKIASTFAKWIVTVSAAVASVQVGWSNLSKWLAR